MFEISGFIGYDGPTPDLMASEFNGVKREAYQKLGEHFFRVNLPRRFTWAGGRMLGYAARSPKYERYKRKVSGSAEPNVGVSRNQARSRDIATRIMDVRSTATAKTTRAQIVLKARTLNFSNPKSKNKIKPSEEVRRIANSEVPPLTRELKRFMKAGFLNVPFNPKRDELF